MRADGAAATAVDGTGRSAERVWSCERRWLAHAGVTGLLEWCFSILDGRKDRDY